jgi:hypothetical protein
MNQRLAVERAVELCLKLVQQPKGMQVLTQRESPGLHKPRVVQQLEVTNASMVVMLKPQSGCVSPFLQVLTAASATKNPLAGYHEQTVYKMQPLVKVNLQRSQNVFLRIQVLLYRSAP